MVVGRKDNKGKKNKHSMPEKWDSNLKGDVIMFKVDDDGACAPFTLKEHQKWVDEGMPDDEVDAPEESDAEESSDDEEESDGEESSSDEDGDEEDLHVFAERMKDLPVAELRKACRILGLSDKGGKSQLIAKLHAHAQAHAGEEEKDDDDDEDMAWEEQVGAQVPEGASAGEENDDLLPNKSKDKRSKKSAQARASPLKVGPSKKIAKTPKTIAKAAKASIAPPKRRK